MAAGPTVYWSGANGLVPADTVRISPHDRGFVFGDGVYEVLRTYNGSFYRAAEHSARLRASLDAICIDAAQVPDLLQVGQALLAANHLTEGSALVYFQVTRGAAPRTHAFPAAPVPATVYAETSAIVPPLEAQEAGVTIITQDDVRWRRCDVKAIGLLANVLARQKAAEAGAAEAILVRDEVVTEGTHTNVFAVIGGEVRTHPLGDDVLAGVTRGVVLRLCREAGVLCREAPVTREELGKAGEVFLTGTTSEVLPVVTVDGRAVGSGYPGPVTRQLQRAFRADVARCCPGDAVTRRE